MDSRRRQHLGGLRDGKHWNAKIKASCATYGHNAFVFEVIALCPSFGDDIECDLWLATNEANLIAQMKAEFNIGRPPKPHCHQPYLRWWLDKRSRGLAASRRKVRA